MTGELDRAWQAQIGYVAQSPFLVDGTLADNVTLGAGDAIERERRCLEALHSAGLKSLVDSLPGGIYARLGDFGGKLSGGQRQRVTIARALYRNASCLVLDEATSALDSVTERAVVDGIFDLGLDVTVIIIAHRLSLVQRCDRIAVLDQGHLVAIGSHAQLIEQSPIYRNLVNAQSIDE
jgi:ABC-type multidrug transport system fused ATPase/permease subunit